MRKMKTEEIVLLPKKTFRSQETDATTVAEYAALMEQGVEFPPILIAEVGKSKKQVLVGGFHRVAAATKARIKELQVECIACRTAFDAELVAFTDNVSHGLNYTAEDKRQAILAILQTPTGKKLSNAAAAKKLGVSDMTIKRYRDAIGTKSPKAAQSGHKNTATKSNVAPKVDSGGKVVEATSDPVGWKIAGAKLGGGADRIADAIVAKVTEGVSTKQPKSYMERVQTVEDVIAQLQGWVDGAKSELAK